MGIFAGLAHLPFIGPLTTAAAHAPDTLTAAVGATTSGATAGLSMAAIGGALVLGPTTPTTNAFASTLTTVNVIDAAQAPQLLRVEASPTSTTQAATKAPVWRPVTVVAEAGHSSTTTTSTTTTVPVTSPPVMPPPAQPVQVAQVQANRTTPVVPAPLPTTTVVQVHEDAPKTDKGDSDEGHSDKGKSKKGKSDEGHGGKNNSDHGGNNNSDHGSHD